MLTPEWRKSSHSTGEPCNCVEARRTGSRVEIRDSKDPSGPTLAISTAAWGDLIRRMVR
jgi:hypothetical protein